MMDTDFERFTGNVGNYIPSRNAKLTKEQLAEMTAKITRQYNGVKALDIWLCFKRLHPNTPESPDYSEASVKRWLYHINEAEKNKGFERAELDMSEIERIREENRVKKWADFNSFQKVSYRAIAESYMGVQIFACGSQVRGDYMEYPPREKVIIARQKAGMRTDRLSDFDFWVEHGFKPTSPLPNYADRYRGKFNEKEMVAIPIYYGDV